MEKVMEGDGEEALDMEVKMEEGLSNPIEENLAERLATPASGVGDVMTEQFLGRSALLRCCSAFVTEPLGRFSFSDGQEADAHVQRVQRLQPRRFRVGRGRAPAVPAGAGAVRGGQCSSVTEAWQAIATAVGTRDMAQVVHHARLYFAQLQQLNVQRRQQRQFMQSVDQRWTPDEDAAFENMLAAFSSSSVCYPWEAMASRLPGKSPVDLKERYQKLCYDVARIESGQHVTMHFGQFPHHSGAAAVDQGRSYRGERPVGVADDLASSARQCRDANPSGRADPRDRHGGGFRAARSARGLAGGYRVGRGGVH
ncbi:putative tripeptidyl-peptidase [Phytophthora cinnamomi]|uniref:putative tripeptidyl-peptidase n=1 Tax=Phytophthora cinnamomi TaxID=4785 RepID=UPI003559F468|nr:putative tripeptidyl-peptidase [Phytophthora cinnamomi]